MRVLILSKACIVGIYQRKLEIMARQPDLELLVLVPPNWKDERGITPLERVYTEGYTLLETPIRFNGRFHIHYYPRFKQVVREFNPDIIHIDEEPYNLATWLAWRVARRVPAKTVIFSWQNILRAYPFPFNLIEKQVLNGVDYLIAGTQTAAEVWQSKGYTGSCTVIPQFGVDETLFYPPDEVHPHPNGPIQIGFAGRLVAEKGLEVLLNALGVLQNQFGVPPTAWQLKIIGGGPLDTQLKALAQQKGIAERVEFTGLVPSVAMPGLFRALDVLVVPSLTRPNWKEQYGRVIIEAMASGVAVIGSDSGAIPDVIGPAGVIVPEAQVYPLAEALKTLIQDRPLRENLGKIGRERILAQFTQEQIALQTLAVYRELAL